jgi:ATP-binding cassette subfamily C protein EexD
LQATNKLAVVKQGLLEAYGDTKDILAKISGQQRQIKRPPNPSQKITLSKPGS